jgi:hypothetical protein
VALHPREREQQDAPAATAAMDGGVHGGIDFNPPCWCAWAT